MVGVHLLCSIEALHRVKPVVEEVIEGYLVEGGRREGGSSRGCICPGELQCEGAGHGAEAD